MKNKKGGKDTRLDERYRKAQLNVGRCTTKLSLLNFYQQETTIHIKNLFLNNHVAISKQP